MEKLDFGFEPAANVATDGKGYNIYRYKDEYILQDAQTFALSRPMSLSILLSALGVVLQSNQEDVEVEDLSPESMVETKTEESEEPSLWFPVSSNISQVSWYDDTMDILFTSGGFYRYDNVPREVLTAWQDAAWAGESVGRYFNLNIRGKFESNPVV